MASRLRTRIVSSERGTALLEAALIVPVVLLIMVGIFEVARAYQTFQVLTNAAREGARAAVIPSGDADTVKAIVKKYMEDGQLSEAAAADIDVDRQSSMVVNGTTISASLVTVEYPFEFMMLQPIAQLVVKGSKAGEAFNMQATSLMRNEAQ